MGYGKSVCFLIEMEGREEKDEEIMRKEQTKKEEGLHEATWGIDNESHLLFCSK